MNLFRAGSVWAAGLVWLAVGVGCADTAESDTEPEEIAKYTGPVIITEEIDPVENPLSDEPGAIEIPLSQISAFPPSPTLSLIGGELHNTSPDTFNLNWSPLILEVYRTLSQRLPKKGNLPPGFAVIGVNADLETLQHVHDVLVKKRPPRQSFQADNEITLVFFSYPPAPRTQLHRVDRVENRIEIRFRFIPSAVGDKVYPERPPVYFALISLGKLEAGKYRVSIVKSALERQLFGPDFIPDSAFQEKMVRELENRVYKPMSREEARKMVCNSFSFTVEEK